MTELEMRADSLSRELEAAFRNRADLYRLMLQEFRTEFGQARAEDLMIRIIEKRGREVGATAFAKFGPNEARALGEAFLAVSPDGGRMYPTRVDRSDRSITFRVSRCPLKDAWTQAGVSDADLETLCRVAGAFDRGLFETCGVRFANTTWWPGHGQDCCHITLTDRDAGSNG